MEAVSGIISTTFVPSLSRSNRGRRTSPQIGSRGRKGGDGGRAVGVTAAIKRSNSYGSGRQVDESMIVLRKRIHEMKVIERNYQPPSHWMDWEKQIYASYDDIICRALAVVQCRLMDTRPSVAIAALALLAVSVPTSFLLLTMQIAKAVAAVAAAAAVPGI